MKQVPKIGDAKLRKLHDRLATCKSFDEALATCRLACQEEVTISDVCSGWPCAACILGARHITSWDQIIIPLKLHLTKGDEDNA